MSQTAVTEKLGNLFRSLSPRMRSVLEDALAQEPGDSVGMQEVRRVLADVRGELGDGVVEDAPQVAELIFAPLAPFLVDLPPRHRVRGILAKAGQARIQVWAEAHAAPEIFAEFQGFHHASADERAQRSAISHARERIAERVGVVLAAADDDRARARLSAQIGYDGAAEDAADVVAIFRAHKLLSAFAADVGAAAALQGEEQMRALRGKVERIAAAQPGLVPFALRLVRQQIASIPHFVRLAAEILEANSQDAIALQIVEMALGEADIAVAGARDHMRRGPQVLDAAIREFGAIARALATEIDLPSDGRHARRLAGLRAEFAETIRAHLQDISPRVRRLVRPRAEEKPNERPDPEEMRRLQGDLETLMRARAFAEEIAINAFTARACREIREMLDMGTPLLIERMRGEGGAVKAAVRTRLDGVARISAIVFGREFAATLHKSIELAAQDNTRPQARTA